MLRMRKKTGLVEVVCKEKEARKAPPQVVVQEELKISKKTAWFLIAGNQLKEVMCVSSLIRETQKKRNWTKA
ncbi:hypothetical protein Y032_0004g2145 [Ancylostoma ceylanicum]|uniref:Uncharacterized protein n=1 Tax=Ancylostoma ceylanicum TaxID=53326 RepID=A0A016VUZ5_9BILA|nr:hypothetical protein Y032_0004g2145 [Ancylostoma ceylanicum]